ncbi:hypothetical protein ACFP2T_36100 [Plantactinospora solaniradicis]|uniref:Septum formation-related domain-containing protein n=1 Tax=Plantactinospora solaniradicis TaxID=1723736 RepID=A0ABW1KIL4_9ACTN
MEDDLTTVESPPPAGRGGSLRLLIGFGVVLAVVLVAAGYLIGTRFGGSSNGSNQTASGLPSSDAAPGPASKAAALSACMRENGITNYPNPGPNGVLRIGQKDGIDITSPEFKKADKACEEFKPKAGQMMPPPPSVAPSFDATQYVACMRQNGIPDFPDSVDGMFAYDPNKPGFADAQKVCDKFLPTDAPPPPR